MTRRSPRCAADAAVRAPADARGAAEVAAARPATILNERAASHLVCVTGASDHVKVRPDVGVEGGRKEDDRRASPYAQLDREPAGDER